MEITIKKIGIESLNLLMDWRKKVLSEVFALNDIENHTELILNNENYYKNHLTDGTHTAFFAINDDTNEIIGCGGICYQDEMPSPDNMTGKNGYLMNIYIEPKYRKCGAGKKIIETLILDAKENNACKIYLESSDIAKNLYEEIGFVDMINYMKFEGV